MPGLATGAASPLRHDAPTNATSAPLVGHAEVNGICLPYVEQGSGQPVVFVHGALSDLRGWEPVRQEMAKRGESATKYRFIAYSQRYFGTHRWTDSGKRFSAATHADDLVKFIAALDTGPVHLVGTSYGGLVVTTAAITTPTLVRASSCMSRRSHACSRTTVKTERPRAKTEPNSSGRSSPPSGPVIPFGQPG